MEGSGGDGGLAINAQFTHPIGVCVDHDGRVFVSDNFDQGGNVVRVIDASGIINRYAGTGNYGVSGSGQALSNSLAHPIGISIDQEGRLFIADQDAGFIKMVDINGYMTNVAGNGGRGYSGDGGLATSASLNYAYGVFADHTGKIYIADTMNNVVRMVHTSGIISTVAGTGKIGYSGDGFSALQII
jgi:glucose/arabinose dehydrogenase